MADDILCPSYCDSQGRKHDRKLCIDLPFCCCLAVGLLDCCDDSRLQIDDVSDNYNCSTTLPWKTALGVCVPVGTLCLLGIIVLLAYQYRRSLHHFLFRPPPARASSFCSTVSRASSVVRDAVPPGGQTRHQAITADGCSIELGPVAPLPAVEVVWTVQPPPPYISANPPEYTDIFPS
jgi:hypothetical protein